MTHNDLLLIRRYNDMIADATLKLDEVRQKAFPGAIRYDNTGASKPMPTNQLEAVFERLLEIEHRIDVMIWRRYLLQKRAIEEIQDSELECAARHILYLRYLATDNTTYRPLTWSDVFRYVNKLHNIQRSKMFKLHHEGVAELEKYNI